MIAFGGNFSDGLSVESPMHGTHRPETGGLGGGGCFQLPGGVRTGLVSGTDGVVRLKLTSSQLP